MDIDEATTAGVVYNSLFDMLDRVRAEREEAFKRASLYARHAERMEKALQSFKDDACCDETAYRAEKALEEANTIFNEEWRGL